jgi:putative iron-dependent peroxidase
MVGWPYHRDLDLTGFIDGTENPPLVEASMEAIIPAGSPGEGGSVLLLQQWEHNAIGWETLPIPQQEAIIGRRKSDSLELDPRPETSHVARTDQDTFGKILRRNIAYGTLALHGTIFVGFSRERSRLDQMLISMAGRGNAARDALTLFTNPLTGAYYFVPSTEALAAFAAVPAGD